MGIDIYMYWPGMTPQDKALQYVGFSALAGSVGYLREAYHGSPYATKFLVTEAFLSDSVCTCGPDTFEDRTKEEYETGMGNVVEIPTSVLDMDRRCDHCKGVPIPADILEERLPETLRLAEERERKVYNRPDGKDVQDSIRDFVKLAREKEEEHGEPVRIFASY